MRKQLVASTLIAVFFFMATGLLTARATTGARISATIPFAFVIKGRVLPAGKYTIVQVCSDSAPLLRFSGEDGKGGMFVQLQLSEYSETSQETLLVFHRYGSEYYLSEVRAAGRTSGMRLPTTPAEERLAKITAQVDRSIVTIGGIAQ